MEDDRHNPKAPPRRKKKIPRSESSDGVSLCNEMSGGKYALNAAKSASGTIPLADLNEDAVRNEGTVSSSPTDQSKPLDRLNADISGSSNYKAVQKGAISNIYQRPPPSPRSGSQGLSKSVENVCSSVEIRSSKENIYLESLNKKNPSLSLSLKSPDKAGDESPKQKPVRPERPKPFASQGSTPKRSPVSKSPSSSATLKSVYSGNSASSRAAGKAAKEGELTIIDSKEKAIVRKGSTSEENKNERVFSPTSTSRSAYAVTTTTRQSGVKEWLAKGKQETAMAALGVRSKAQSLMRKVKSNTFSKSGSPPTGHSKVTHRPPEKPPRPTPPVKDGPIYETVKTLTPSRSDSAPGSSNYSYVDVSPGWWHKGGDDKTKKWATLPASCRHSSANSVSSSVEPSSSPLYTELTSDTIDDDGVYEEMRSFVPEYTSLRTSPSPALSAGHPSSDSGSPSTTAKHLLSTENNVDEDEDDYMFMSSITLDEPSMYMDIKHHPATAHPSHHDHPSTHPPQT